MGPRASRRRVVVDDDDADDNDVQGSEVQPEEVEDSPRPQRRAAGKFKSVKNSKPSTVRSSKAATPQASPRKLKGNAKAAKESPKPSAKPIYSFFNSATQRQQVSQPSTSPEKLSVLHEEVELIHDDIDNEPQKVANTTLSKGSSTALAMRKRKFQRTQSFEDEVAAPPAASQKFRKASGGDRVPSLSALNSDKRPWTEQFAPVDLSELAVHKRKVADVRNWLEMTFRGRRSKVLVLKGPAGTGKTTTVQLLAKDLGVELLDWKDPTVADYGSDGFVSTAARFSEFIGRAGRSAGLVFASGNANGNVTPQTHHSDAEKDLDNRPQALLIEEFPNTFSRTSSTLQSFRTTIAQYVAAPVPGHAVPTPIIMVISETLLSTNTASADSFTAHRLLGPELSTSPYVDVIEFNPVAPTYLTKALETIVVKEARKSGRRRTPGPQVLKHLAETGDIRSAVSSLEFLCLRGDEGDTWSSKVMFTKPKQSKTHPPLTKSEEEALKLITNRESTLSIFHSVGKVVYNKRTEVPNAQTVVHPPPWLSQHRRSKIPETDPETLIDELGTDTATFIAGLHHNFPLSCSSSRVDESLGSLLGCMESLSDADLLSLDRFSFGTRAFSGSTTDTLRQDEMWFNVAVRGMLFSLPNPVHRSAGSNGSRAEAHRMFYPASLRLFKKREEIESKLEHVINRLANGRSDGAASSIANDGLGAVESWKRNNSFKTNDDKPDSVNVDTIPQASTEIRNEMLLDRLPYMSQILSSSKAPGSSRSLLEHVLAISHISSNEPVVDEDAEIDEGDEQVFGTEQWSTDRPDAETGGVALSTPKKQTVSRKQKTMFEAMSIPVETRVEKLVLEDDDIVDD